MRATINFKLNNSITLPIQYNYIIHNMILKWINNIDNQKYIYNKVFKTKSKNYKLYTFSKLQGKFNMDIKNKKITYFDEVSLVISSYSDKFLSNLINTLIIKGNIDVIGNNVEIDKIETSISSIKSSDVKIYAKSPITVYNTFKVNGKNRTYYYSPFEEQFENVIKRNLVNKYIAYYGDKPKDENFFIKVLNPEDIKQSVVVYNGIIIKGWNGRFVLNGSRELMDLAYQSGIGYKNSHGFGCIEIIGN